MDSTIEIADNTDALMTKWRIEPIPNTFPQIYRAVPDAPYDSLKIDWDLMARHFVELHNKWVDTLEVLM